VRSRSASLALVNTIGVDLVEARVLGLARLLYEELDRIGVRLVTRPEDTVRSGITTFEVSDDPGDNEAFLECLLDERIYVSLRYTSGVGGIRVSTHYFNDESDLEVLLGAVRRLSERKLTRRRTTEGRVRDRGPGASALESLGLQTDGYHLENSSL
jgi:cysteine desulfurase / selenocysteine lyase